MLTDIRFRCDCCGDLMELEEGARYEEHDGRRYYVHRGGTKTAIAFAYCAQCSKSKGLDKVSETVDD